MKGYKVIPFDEKDKYQDYLVKCEGCDANECDKSNSSFCPAFRKKYENTIKIYVRK